VGRTSAALLAAALATCALAGTASAAAVRNHATSRLRVASTAFREGGLLPVRYTCDGAGDQPPVAWTDAPSATKAFAVTMTTVPGPVRPGDDPARAQNPFFSVFNIPAAVHSLAINSSRVGEHGPNFKNGQLDYTPPCSQGPGLKRYTITVYALSATLRLRPSQATEAALQAALRHEILASASISALYARP
jgi:phosphatidylethanolamine-binding protein (PEBP) family uncharacterized protein